VHKLLRDGCLRSHFRAVVVCILCVFCLCPALEGTDKINYAKLRGHLAKLRAQLKQESEAIIASFNKAWKAAGDPELPIGAEEIVKGSGIYKIEASGCPRGTAKVTAQIVRSNTITGAGKLSGKAEVKILGVGGEIGGEIGGSVARTSGGSLQIKGCLLLDAETRANNDSTRLWQSLFADLKRLAPLYEELFDGDRLLELIKEVEVQAALRDKLNREIRTRGARAPKELVANLLRTLDGLERAEKERDRLIEKLRAKGVITSS
jgi:hypothetical protein